MSHTFRLLAVGFTVVLCLIGTPVKSFTLSRQPNITLQDLYPEDSIALEVRNDIRRPNDIEITKQDALIPTEYIKDFITTIQDQAIDSSIDTTQNIEFTTQNVDPTTNEETTIIESDENHSDDNILRRISYPTQTERKHTPSWKKYTVINRKLVNSEIKENGKQTEGMLTQETGVPRQDSKSGDIPSLNQIKNFLFPSSFFKTEVQNDTTVGVTEQSLTSYPETSAELTTTVNSAIVESKRGGFLDFSLKSLFDDHSDKKDNSQENNISKPKGRRLSWRFGSRHPGKDENSAEKSKEKSRYRFRNNKDRKKDNNDTKESKEAYSREVDSREDSDKRKSPTNENDNSNEKYRYEFKDKNNAERKETNKSNRYQTGSNERNQYEKNKETLENKEENLPSNDKANLKNDERITKSNRKELVTSDENTSTDINIWYTDTTKKSNSHEKQKHDFKIPKQSNSEERRGDHSKHRGRGKSENSNQEDSQAKTQVKTYTENKKDLHNEHRTDKNDNRNVKEHETNNSKNVIQKHEYDNKIKNSTMDSYMGRPQPNRGQTKYDLKTKEINQESETKNTRKDNKPTSHYNIEIKKDNDVKEENNTDNKVTIEYIKKFLSTIDEEEEHEHSPTIEETTTTKPTDVPNIVAVNYSTDLKLNDIDTTTQSLNYYEPIGIPNLLITLPNPRNKDETHENSKVSQNEYKNVIETTTEFDYTERRKYVTDISNNRYKHTKNIKTIVHMHEDNRREELLKEEVFNNNEENNGKFNEEPITTTQTTFPVKIYEVNQKPDDEKLNVKPLSFLDKLKTTILYPVSPNYKPLKKIEVQQPKLFVRDPDDNSWRNESLSSLGIVFNPKNSSKPFTQVLKNKTETDWNNLMEKQNKSETPDLRERLEKIAEMRKSKKKKTDVYGNVLYTDYEESLSRETKDSEFSTSTTMVPTTTFTTTSTLAPSIEPLTLNISKSVPSPTTEKPKKVFNAAEYYDTSNEDDADYLTLAKIDLKKFTVPFRNDAYVTPPTWLVTNTGQSNHNIDDRKPTLQYFPPLTTHKGMFRDYETDFHKKMGAYTETEPPTNVLPVSYTRPSFPIQSDMKEGIFTPYNKNFNEKTTEFLDYDKPGYMTQAPVVPNAKDGYTVVTDDGSYNRAADVIKHYRDFLNAVAKDHEEDINEDYLHTKTPTHGVTVTDIHKTKPKPDQVEHYDYENDFRNDVLQRFVHNFNQNSERFKSNLPLLYNNSVIHGSAADGRDVASSRAYLSRMLTRPSGDCDNNATMELSPAYELHYYVPEEEEKEQVDSNPATLPYKYRL